MRFANYNSGAAGLTPPYEIPNHWIGFYRARAVVRQGSYRSLAAVANAFARESHVDEWAEELAIDPVEFRLKHITDARLREVIERTAARFGWGKARSGNGRGVGMSCNLEKDARLALFVEVEAVEADDRRVRVVRMVATGDFGAALNPGALQSQLAGGLIQGIGGALWERVIFDGSGTDGPGGCRSIASRDSATCPRWTSRFSIGATSNRPAPASLPSRSRLPPSPQPSSRRPAGAIERCRSCDEKNDVG